MQAKKKRLTILYSAYILVSLNPYRGRLAQLVEHLTFNQVVTGSIPVAPTTSLKISSSQVLLKNSGSKTEAFKKISAHSILNIPFVH